MIGRIPATHASAPCPHRRGCRWTCLRASDRTRARWTESRRAVRPHLSRNRRARLTARLPPNECPTLAMFSGSVALTKQPIIGLLNVFDLRGELVLRRTPVVDHQRPHTGGLGDMGGRLPVAVHRCDDAATHVAVKQNGAGLAIGGNTPEGLDPAGIDFFVCDAFGFFRRDVHRLDDVPNGGKIKIGIRHSLAQSSPGLRELSRFIACHGVTFRFCTGRSGRRQKSLR